MLTKGSLNHLTRQLKKTPAEHFADIARTIDYAKKHDRAVNIYLEDWSNGWLHSREYMFSFIDFLVTQPVGRIMLPDTLGVLYPAQVAEAIAAITGRYPENHFDFHPHNDYGLGTINVLEAIRAGAHGVHTTVNCLGERTGNASLAEVVAGIHDHLQLKTTVNEKSLYQLSRTVETFSGKRLAANAPIVGEDVFTQTAGIHADGDKKGALPQFKTLTWLLVGTSREPGISMNYPYASDDKSPDLTLVPAGDGVTENVTVRVTPATDDAPRKFVRLRVEMD